MRKYLFVALFFLIGCTTVPAPYQPPQNKQPIRTGSITSNPSGADVFYFDSVNEKKLLGQTPCQITYQSPDASWVDDGYLLIALTGYETSYLHFKRAGAIDYNFDLDKDISMQIKESNPPQNKEYLKRVVDVIGKCDKLLHSPKMLAASVASEANSENQKLQIDYPQYKEIVLNKYLSTLVNLCVSITNSDYLLEQPILIVQVQNLISKIKLGIGVK